MINLTEINFFERRAFFFETLSAGKYSLIFYTKKQLETIDIDHNHFLAKKGQHFRNPLRDEENG